MAETAYKFMRDVWKDFRSITGAGTRATVETIRSKLPKLQVYEVATGTKVGDWTIPQEWTFRDAYLEDSYGTRIVDARENNLHIVNYSEPIEVELDLQELNKYLHSIPELPDAIPYRTSYYKKSWGLCLTHNKRLALHPGKYKVKIDTDHKSGSMTVADLVVRGKSNSEVVFTTYICHPMMANNELSGPAVAISLAQYIQSRENYYTYRFVFAPETIGSIWYLSQNLKSLKDNVVAGFVLTCLGDANSWGYIPSRSGMTIADKIIKRVLQKEEIPYAQYSFLDRGSDERQYCSPKVNLPFCSVTRSKYGTYKEYHTSADNLDYVSIEGLEGSISFYLQVIDEIENNRISVSTTLGEPMMSKHGLRGFLGGGMPETREKEMSDILALSDGSFDTTEFCSILKLDKSVIEEHFERLCVKGLISLK